MKYSIVCNSFEKSNIVNSEIIEFPLIDNQIFEFKNYDCKAQIDISKKNNEMTGSIKFSFLKNMAIPMNVALRIEIENWSRDAYVFVPGAVYNGNRFECKPMPYPPYNFIDRKNALIEKPAITDIPHLSPDEVSSKIQLRSGDMTTPAIGYYDDKKHTGLLLFGKHIASEDYTGFSVEEDLKNKIAIFSFSAPAVREEVKYYFEEPDNGGFYPNAHTPSDDVGKYFDEGECIELEFKIVELEVHALSEFFRNFNEHRTCLEFGKLNNVVPFHFAYQTVKDKYQKYNFREEGYYCVGTESIHPEQCWQAGWIGGGMNNYPFLLEDSEEVFQRAVSTYQFILDKLQTNQGWIWGMYHNGKFYGDCFKNNESNSILLLRKNADLLYFLLKQSMFLKENAFDIKKYEDKICKLVEAFVSLYEKYNQIGQFIDLNTNEIVIGNSSSAGIAVGALSLAYEYFGDKRYLEVAEKLGDLYYIEYVSKGILNGCPGEILQAPDSEAAFAMLEGYVQLYETTKAKKWLTYGKESCEIAMTWVMSYNFHFPAESTAAKRNARTIGTVFANVQNKHSAPGICTLSGNSLLKLYRFTKDDKYLKYLYSISHSITQFVSLPDRPILTNEKKYLPAGFMNERVQTSDWEGKERIGEFLNGSNWPETSLLLTYVEVPGVYIDLANGMSICFDHINSSIKNIENGVVHLELVNETHYETEVTILIDNSNDLDFMKHNYYGKMEKVFLNKFERKLVSFKVV